MMERTPQSGSPSRSFGEWLLAMPTWKKVAVGVAATLIVVGGAISLLQSGSTDSGASGAAGLQAQLLPSGQGSGTAQTGLSEEEPAAKGVFRLGFSFLAGFCLGSFLRATMRLASIAIGFWLAMTLLLSYYGLVVVDWGAIEGLWERFTSNVESEWGNFQRFLTGSLPAAGLAIAGMATGLKRH